MWKSEKILEETTGDFPNLLTEEAEQTPHKKPIRRYGGTGVFACGCAWYWTQGTVYIRQVLTTEPHPQPSSVHLKGKDENRTREAEGKLTAYWWVEAHFECNHISHQTGQEKRKWQAVYFRALFLHSHTLARICMCGVLIQHTTFGVMQGKSCGLWLTPILQNKRTRDVADEENSGEFTPWRRQRDQG